MKSQSYDLEDDSQYLIDQIKEAPYSLGYFSFPECQVCKVLRPQVQGLLQQFPSVKYLYIDINHQPLLKGQFLVFSVPTIILFQQGRELKRFSRHIGLQQLEDYLKRIIQP